MALESQVEVDIDTQPPNKNLWAWRLKKRMSAINKGTQPAKLCPTIVASVKADATQFEVLPKRHDPWTE